VAELQDYVNEIVVFEESMKADNVFMVNASMNVYLLGHLFFLIAFRQQFLGNDFSRKYSIRFHFFDFVTSCESSLEKVEKRVRSE
jgi:hypothetical protein